MRNLPAGTSPARAAELQAAIVRGADDDGPCTILMFNRSRFWVYPGFPTLFWGLSVFFVGDLMGKALWKLVENAARFPRRGGRVLCVHGAVCAGHA